MKLCFAFMCLLLAGGSVYAQDQSAGPTPEQVQSHDETADDQDHAGFVPVISGGLGYLYTVDAGFPSIEPQINPLLLVPFGSHWLLQSRTEFTGFFEPQHGNFGPYTGKVFKTVSSAEVDWLANTHVMAAGGRFLLPFGLFNERLSPIWIQNLQDAPITATIGTRNSGSGDGIMLRGMATQQPSFSVQYAAYYSARSNINQLQAERASGGDASIYFTKPHLEIGTSYQRSLQQHQINSEGIYLSWQPPKTGLDTKLEYDSSFNGRGYWLESSYLFRDSSLPKLVKPIQLVGRVQQFHPLNGGGNSLPRVPTEQVDFGLNYYFKDNFRFISNYGRSFSRPGNANIWNVGFTYRFDIPLWPLRPGK